MVARSMLRGEAFYCYGDTFEDLVAVLERDGAIGTFGLYEVLKKRFAANALDEETRSHRIREMIQGWKELSTPANIEIECAAVLEASNRRRLNNIAAVIERDKEQPSAKSLSNIEEKIEEIRNSMDEGKAENVRTMLAECERIYAGELSDYGWPQSKTMASTCCMAPGSLTVLCGSPGASKSFYAMEALWRWLFAGIPTSSMQLEKGFHFHIRRACAQIGKTQGLTSNIWVKNHPEQANDAMAQCLPQMTRLEDAMAFQIPPKNTLPTRAFLTRWIKQEIRRGVKIIMIDPITMMSCDKDRWRDEETFILECAQICRENPIRIILVTHPKNGIPGQKITPALSAMQGSTAFSRFVDSVFWLEIHDVEYLAGAMTEKYNRTMHFLKCKLGPGEGKRVGMWFENDTLCCTEKGQIP